MLYNKQLFRHDPANGSYGDCHRTAIACMLDKLPEEVPNFGVHHDSDTTSFHRMVDDYLATQGLMEFSFPCNGTQQDILTLMGTINSNSIYILCGKSPRGFNHSIVCKGGEIIHDPFMGGGNLVGPCDPDGYYWISVLAKRLC